MKSLSHLFAILMIASAVTSCTIEADPEPSTKNIIGAWTGMVEFEAVDYRAKTKVVIDSDFSIINVSSPFFNSDYLYFYYPKFVIDAEGKFLVMANKDGYFEMAQNGYPAIRYRIIDFTGESLVLEFDTRDSKMIYRLEKE